MIHFIQYNMVSYIYSLILSLIYNIVNSGINWSDPFSFVSSLKTIAIALLLLPDSNITEISVISWWHYIWYHFYKQIKTFYLLLTSLIPSQQNYHFVWACNLSYWCHNNTIYWYWLSKNFGNILLWCAFYWKLFAKLKIKTRSKLKNLLLT